ncbi:MAG: hypothetical protein EA341_08840 [Mongoliibacter sp.]|nr:MAG: hypothetical protein EA341_08840 [Mongoliibacter sp.]
MSFKDGLMIIYNSSAILKWFKNLLFFSLPVFSQELMKRLEKFISEDRNSCSGVFQCQQLYILPLLKLKNKTNQPSGLLIWKAEFFKTKISM